MTLRSFLDAAHALLVNEYQRLGKNLMDALKETEMWRAGGRKEEAVEALIPQRQRSSEDLAAAQNDQALQALQMMLAGATRA